jgi:hypothetical protein
VHSQRFLRARAHVPTDLLPGIDFVVYDPLHCMARCILATAATHPPLLPPRCVTQLFNTTFDLLVARGSPTCPPAPLNCRRRTQEELHRFAEAARLCVPGWTRAKA